MGAEKSRAFRSNNGAECKEYTPLLADFQGGVTSVTLRYKTNNVRVCSVCSVCSGSQRKELETTSEIPKLNETV